MKRSLDDSDNDDFYDDDIKDGSPSQSYHLSDRKKRRGVIEKRRRDRINSSLTELRRLVPAAFEKQGSAKLEKAEILQMAVDHLKSLNVKGLSGYNIDTATLAMDYRLVGFRECAAEVARYLVSIEGLDVQDPLRLRVINHLQCYCAQREAAAAKVAVASSTLQGGGTAWGHHPQPVVIGGGGGGGGGTLIHPVGGQYCGGGGGSLAPSSEMLSVTIGGQYTSGGGGGHGGVGASGGRGGGMEHLAMAAAHHQYHDNNNGGNDGVNRGNIGLGGGAGSRMTSQHQSSDSGYVTRLPSMTLSSHMGSSTSCSSSAGIQMTPPSSMLASLAPVHHATQFFGSMPMLSPNSLQHYNTAASMALSQGMRPYRPWGVDLVY